MPIPSKEKSSSPPLAGFLNPINARKLGPILVLGIFSASLLFLFSYRNLSNKSSLLEKRGHFLSRALNDLETLRKSALRRKAILTNNPPASPKLQPLLLGGLLMQSLADLEDLEHLSLSREGVPSLSPLASRLTDEKKELTSQRHGNPESVARLLALEDRVLSETAREHDRYAFLKKRNDHLQDEIGLREERLLAISLITIALGLVTTLALFALNQVIRKERQEIGRREGLLNGLLTSSTNGIILKDMDGRWIDLSPRASDLLNLSENRSDILGKTDADIVALNPHIAAFVAESRLTDPLILSKMQSFQSTVSIPDRDSRVHHLLIDRSPLFSRQNETLGTITTIIDITDRIAVEELQKALTKIAAISLEFQDPQEFLTQVCRILMDHSDFLLVWTTKVFANPGTDSAPTSLLLENFESRSPRFVLPVSLPAEIREGSSDLLLENGQGIDSWVIEHGRSALFSSLTLTRCSGKFPFFSPETGDGSPLLPLTMASFPLVQEGRLFGTLGFLSMGQSSLSPQIEEILSRLSVSISLVLENMQSDLGRRQAEHKSLQLKNFYEALSNVATLLLSLPPPGVLLDSACRILAETGNASTCWIRVEDPDQETITLPYHAGGLDLSEMRLLERMANDPDTLSSSGFSREALRTKKPMVLNNLTLLAGKWTPSRFLLAHGIYALCSLPFQGTGPMKMTLVVGGDRPDYFTPELISLLSHLTENISFGIGNYGREIHRQQTMKKTERLKNIYHALSDANEILLTHRNPDTIFETLCRTIILYSHATTAGIYLLDKESQTGRLVAWDGPAPVDMTLLLTPSSDHSLPEGKGLLGKVVRSGNSQTLTIDDISTAKSPGIRVLFEQLDVRSIGAFPIRRGGEIFGVLLLTSTEPYFFDDELRGLIDRMVLNISFSLDHYDNEEMKKEREKTILYQSLHDMLTGLPNRILFVRQIEEAIQQSSRSGGSFGVGIIDIDNFKEINDRLGHKTGDSLLQEVSKRLREKLRNNDALARLGGDEFGILVRDVGSTQGGGKADQNTHPALASLLETMIGSLDTPFHLGEETIQSVSMSIGVALFPDQGSTAEVLMKRSDLALYDSKSRQGGMWTLFSNDLESRLERTFLIRSDFDRSLENDEILLFAQPQTSFDTGHPSGVEILARWNHPRKGLLHPGAFIQEVENSPPLIRKLGLVILERALDLTTRWQDQGLVIPVAVNIGARHFLDPHFTEDISRILSAHATVPPSSLQIEITESATLSDFKNVQSILTHLRSLGVEVALDDFGTGHASLSYLQKIPADTIKMDLQFVRDILVDPKDLAIVAGTLTTARLLKLKTVAEGVESPQHGVVLMKLGCRSGQGYGIAPPMPVEEIPGWLATYTPDPLMKEWSSHPWSRRNIQNLALYMEHHRRSEALYTRIRDAETGHTEREKSYRGSECPLSLWVKGKGSQFFGHSPLFQEVVNLHHKAHELARKMESLLRYRRAAEALPMISEHRGLNEGIIRAIEDLGPEEIS